MNKYIERKALLETLACAPVTMSVCMNVDECKGRIYERERIVRIINEEPIADVRENKRGQWIGEADGYADGELVYDIWYCSNCDYAVDKDEKPEWNFCPNCGTQMDL